MVITRIQSTSTQSTQNKELLEAQQKRLQLNQVSTFERSSQVPKSVNFSNGQTVMLPSGNQSEQLFLFNGLLISVLPLDCLAYLYPHFVSLPS